MGDDTFRGPWIRSFDFTSGARRSAESVTHRAALTQGTSRRYCERWAVSEDNILLIEVGLWIHLDPLCLVF